MPPAEWIDLAERCAAATGPDREIDVAFAEASGDVPAGYERMDAWTWFINQQNMPPLTYRPAYFTNSLDAIVALIEREFPGSSFKLGRDGTGAIYAQVAGKRVVEAATPALALCASFCRAMAEKGSRQ